MKTAAATLALTMMIAACAEKERYPERYLDAVNLTLHSIRDAEVSGYLRPGARPDNALVYPDLTGTSGLVFRCAMEDSGKLVEALELQGIPVTIDVQDYCSNPSVSYRQEGILWKPVYSWNIQSGQCTFSARVSISNTTGREWFSQSTVFMDSRGQPACTFQDTLLIRNGEMELGWWSARGTVLPLTIFYGWPHNSQWNQLTPCLVPEAGDFYDRENIWPIKTGDTLWIETDTELDITEMVEPYFDGYDCSLIIHNNTDQRIQAGIRHPETTPRGARFLPDQPLPRNIDMMPGDILVFDYSILY